MRRLSIAVSLFLILAPQVSFAADETVQLPEVLVTGDRWETPMEETGNRVTVMDKKEIADLPARDIGATLQYMPGVTIDRSGNGGVGSAVQPTVQGSQYYETTVLIDGIPFNDLTNGIGNIGQIPSELVDRVEVLHGPGGSEWGSSLGGVVNVITAVPDKNERNFVKAGGGDYATGFGAARIQDITESGTSLAVAGAERRSIGFQGEATAVSNESGVGTAKFRVNDAVDLTALAYSFQGSTGQGYYRVTKDIYSAPVGTPEWSKFDYKTSGGGLTAKAALPVGEMRLTGFAQSQYGFTMDNVFGGSGFNDLVMGGSAIWHLGADNNALNLGFDYRGSKTDNVSLNPSVNSFRNDTNGVFVNARTDMGRTTVEGALRHSNEGVYGDVNGFNVAVAQHLADEKSLITASVAQGYTVPTFGQRFVSIPGQYASNPGLKPETAMTYQLGGKTSFGGLETDVNLFYSDVNQAIKTVTLNSGLTQYQNFTKFTRQGVEAAVRWKFENQMYLFANTLQQDVKNAVTNTDVQDWQRQTYSAGLGFAGERVRWLVAGNYRDLNATTGTNGTNAFDRRIVLNANAEYLLPFGKDSFKLFGSIYNITNEDESSADANPALSPRQFEAGLEWMF